MKTLYSGRQTGKTRKLIEISADTKYPIITKDTIMSKELKRRAKRMGVEIPEPITIRQALNTRLVNSRKVLVDDADCILNYLFRELCGSEVDTLALVSRNEKGHELDKDGNDINVIYGIPD